MSQLIPLSQKVKSGSGLNPGAKRYLAAVRLANRSFAGRFDWLIVGDDDVIFLLDNLRDILKNVNPNIPFLITDDLGVSSGLLPCIGVARGGSMTLRASVFAQMSLFV